jgi:Ala-tRNA(Pro) deacylase
MSMPRWISSTLEEEHVPFQIRRHRPCFTAQEVAAAEHVSGHRMAKVVVVKADDELVAVVLPASQRLDMEAVREQLRCSRCRLATEKEIAERFPDCEVGAIPPLPHWDGVRILADARIMQMQGPMVFQAGTHEDAIEMACDDWKRITHPMGARLATSMMN